MIVVYIILLTFLMDFIYISGKVFKKCALNKKIYLDGLLNLTTRVERALENINDSEIDEIRFLNMTDLLRNKNSKAITLVKLYSLADIIKKDVDMTKKQFLFTDDPVKLFYKRYERALEQLPQLKEELV